MTDESVTFIHEALDSLDDFIPAQTARRIRQLVATGPTFRYARVLMGIDLARNVGRFSNSPGFTLWKCVAIQSRCSVFVKGYVR